jgi:hypothetical protein
VVCIYSPPTGAAVIYTNGVLEAAMTISQSLTNVSPNSTALGRSPWSGDPWLNGAIDEFRIYSGVLQPADIAAAQAVGPNVLLTTNASLSISQGNNALTLNWPVAGSGFTLESSPTLGSSAAWTPVINSLLLANTNNQVTIPVTNAALFFRLRR